MKLNLGLAQIATKLGDVDSNLAKHLDFIQQAKEQNVDLLVFPELSLTGYVLQDLVATVAHRPAGEDPVFKHLLQASRDLDLVVGFVDEDSRQRFFIASAYLYGGKVLHVHHKVYLPTYGLFDEGRFFAWGDSVRAFDTRFGRAGLLICEDFWHASPPYLLWLDGADLMLFSLGEVVTNFLTFARPEPLTLAPLELRAIVERAAADVPLEHGRISVSGEFGRVLGDEVLLRQAISNLLRNSVEACAAAGVDPRVLVEGAAEAPNARITVEDNGPGIPPDALAHIFKPFVTTKAHGTGLGLAIVQKVVVSHNGRITAANRPEGGSQFRIHLPLATSTR